MIFQDVLYDSGHNLNLFDKIKQTYNNNTIPNINYVQPNIYSFEDLQYQNNSKM